MSVIIFLIGVLFLRVKFFSYLCIAKNCIHDMNKTLKTILVVVAAVAAFVVLTLLFGTLFGGCIAKNYVNGHGEELLGRKTSVERVGMNLFTGHVSVRDFAVYEDNGTDRFAGFDSLDVGVSLLRLIGKTVYVRGITLSGLDVEVRQEGGHFNFSSIIEHFQKDTVDEPEDTTPSGWVVSMHNIRLVRGRLNYADVDKGSNWGFNDLDLKIPDFTVGGEGQTDAGLTLAFADGGSLMVNAALNPSTNVFDLKLGIDGFALDQVKPYLVDVAYVDRVKGHLSVDAEAAGRLDSLMNATMSVRANLDGVDIRDKEQASVLSLRHLGVDVAKMVLSKNLFDINKVELKGLTARYELFKDSTNTFSRLLRRAEEQADSTAQAAQPEEQDSAKASQPAAPLKLRVGHVDLSEINFTFADHTLPDDFEYAVKDLHLSADNVTTSGSNNARLLATLPSGGKAIVNWEGNISDWKQYQRLRLNIKGLHLTDLSPYMVAYFGMPFTDGVFSFTSLNTINNSKLKGDNRIDIFKPTLGDSREDVKPQLRLPVRAALYILKDKEEKVFLPVPVSGNVDSPKFNYFKLVWKTLGNLIVKVVTTTARAFDSLTVDDKGNQFIEIDPDERDFTSEQFYQIDKVAELAKMDRNVVLNLHLVTRPTHNSQVEENHERRNKILQHHLVELGVPEKQFTITKAEPDKSVKKEGYELIIEN